MNITIWNPQSKPTRDKYIKQLSELFSVCVRVAYLNTSGYTNFWKVHTGLPYDEGKLQFSLALSLFSVYHNSLMSGAR